MGSSKIQGELWSHAATDWAELQEPMHVPLFEAMLEATNVGDSTRLLDVGCGGGTASVIAAKRGAQVSGIDAAPALINIARSRVADGDFQLGDVEKLPFEDSIFDVVFAANSIQYAADRFNAMKGLKRVCRAGGHVAFSVLGQPEDVDYRVIFQAVVETLPEPPPGDGPFGLSHLDKIRDLFAAAGMEIIRHDSVNCPMRYPDLETFWRATRSGGPVVGVMRKVGEDNVKQAVLDAVSDMKTDDGGILIERNMFQYAIARVVD